MKVQSVRLVCFSPTGTSLSIARSVAQGFGAPRVELVDITPPAARTIPLIAGPDELVVFAVPVYMGRIPDLISGWLGTTEGHGALAACVVVYGNRAFEDALLELRDIVAARGFRAIAGAAFVGEHSFSSTAFPASPGRPDQDDLRESNRFGARIRERIESLPDEVDPEELSLPGKTPYGGITRLWDVDFVQVSEDCAGCGLCAEICPTGAVDPLDARSIDIVKCITCCACIKKCPQQARSVKPGPVMEAARRIHTLYPTRKEPELFF